ncbi:MAG: type IV secretion system protein [Methylophilales bacterium]|nr:type IV secretion system protein [Methylophilales bacterium]
MKKHHLKPHVKAFIIALTLAASLQANITPANAGGIPVIDAANLANTLENIVQWGKQLQAMKEQYAQQLAQYQSMTGKRGFGTVLNDPNLRQYLPANAQKVYSQMMRPVQSMDVCYGLTGESLTLCQAEVKKHYIDRDNYEKAYDTASTEQTQIQGLIDQISNTDDPKAIAELQARMAGEQAKIQNTVVQMQLSAQLAEIQNKLLQQTKQDAQVKATIEDRGNPISAPEPITNWD